MQHPLFELAFRPFFLLASALSIIALGLWLGQIHHLFSLGTGISPTVWHAEHMIFGFAGTIAAAFLLTAVQTWTGLPSLHGKHLLTLLLIWLGARLTLLANTPTTVTLGILLQAAWWLMVITVFSRLLIKAKNQRNYRLIPLIGMLASLNIASLALDVSGHQVLAIHLAKTAILLFSLLITIIGGRVLPFFTQAGLKRENIIVTLKAPTPWLEHLLIACTLLGIASFFAELFNPLPTTPYLFFALGALHLLRMHDWQPQKTKLAPLLWSLHAAYFMLALGFIFLGASYFLISLSTSSALHTITIGTMSLMILSMMSRVSLGHTGRTLHAPKALSYAFACMILAALLRSLLPSFGYFFLSWTSSSILWIAAMLIFLTIYSPILWNKKKNSPNEG